MGEVYPKGEMHSVNQCLTRKLERRGFRLTGDEATQKRQAIESKSRLAPLS